MNYKRRDSRFELLRIISMVFIVVCHFSLWGGWTHNYGNELFKNMLFHPLGQIGVYLFAMISGYFLSSKILSFNKQANRVKVLWIKVIIYSYIFLILNFIFKFKIVGLKDTIKDIFPVFFNQYWFMTSFIILMMLVPAINWMMRNSSKKEFIFLIVMFGLFADVYPTLILSNNGPFGGPMVVATLITPYMISAYVKKYSVKISNIIGVLIMMVPFVLEYVLMYLLRNKGLGKMERFNFGILPLISAVGIFLLVLNFHQFYSSKINFLASSVLASYLITVNPLFAMYFNKKLINIALFQDSVWLPIVGIILAIFVVLCCCLIDKVLMIPVNKLMRRFSK